GGGAGRGPRAALPSRDGSRGGALGGPLGGGSRDPQRQGSGQPSVFSQNAFGAPPQGGPGQGGQGQGQGQGRTDRPGTQSGPNSRQDQGVRAGQAGQNGFSGHAQNAFQQGQQGGAPDRGRQLPPPGGPRAELPGGNPQPQRPQTTSWGSERPAVPLRPSLDAPRGHEEHESTGQFARPTAEQQGPGATSEFQRPDFNGPRPDQGPAQRGGPQDVASTAAFQRPDFNAPAPAGYGSGEYGVPQGQNAQSDFRPPAEYPPSEYSAPQQGFNAPRPPAPAPAPGSEGGYRPPSLPAQPQPEALPPAAGPGDGRTPLYDTLETNWFHGSQQGGGQQPQDRGPAAQSPVPPAQQREPMPRREPGNGSGPGGQGTNGSGFQPSGTGGSGFGASGTNGSGANGAGVTSSWRTSPNDELVRQAERVKKPQAGGITTSGLPRRVPRANLVPGTAQEQNNQAGPQVSRAPADVRGRLTNLRRGIQQGRQAGNTGPTNSGFNLGTSHQQER
ncbi:hypothetical protein ACFRKB_25380, partial [Streptomyces scopuliridis]